MTLETLNGQVIVKADSLADVKKLFKLMKEEKSLIEALTPARPWQRRTSAKRECTFCGKQVHGRKGLAVHQRTQHNQEYINNGKHALV